MTSSYRNMTSSTTAGRIKMANRTNKAQSSAEDALHQLHQNFFEDQQKYAGGGGGGEMNADPNELIVLISTKFNKLLGKFTRGVIGRGVEREGSEGSRVRRYFILWRSFLILTTFKHTIYLFTTTSSIIILSKPPPTINNKIKAR